MKELIVSVASVLLALVIGSSIIGLKSSSDTLVKKVTDGITSYTSTINIGGGTTTPTEQTDVRSLLAVSKSIAAKSFI